MTGSTRGRRSPRSTSSSPPMPRPPGGSEALGRLYLRAAVCQHFGKFVWMLDADAHRAATERSIAAMAKAHAHLEPDRGADRGAARRWRPRRQPAAARRRGSSAAAGRRHPRPRLDQGGVLPLRRTRSWPAGWRRCRWTGPGRGRPASGCRSGTDYEVAVAAMLDPLGARPTSTWDRVGAAGSASARLLRAAGGGVRAADPRGGGRQRLRTTSARLWDNLPPLTREAFTVKSGARDEREGRERARALDLTASWSARATGPVRHRRP